MRVFILFLSCGLVFASNYPCDPDVSVDITDGVRTENGIITKDGVAYNPSNYFDYEDRVMGCICNIRSCIRKCCPPGQYIINSNQTCANTDVEFHVNTITSADITTYSIITGKCNTQSVLLDPENSTQDSFTITANGSLLWTDMELISLTEYCVDYIRSTDSVKALICVDENTATVHNTIGTRLLFNYSLIFYCQVRYSVYRVYKYICEPHQQTYTM